MKMYATCTMLSFLLTLCLQTNAAFAEGVPKVTREKVLFFSKNFNVLRHNHKLLEDAYGIDARKNESHPDTARTVAFVMQQLKETLCSDYASAQMQKSHSRLADLELDDSMIPHLKPEAKRKHLTKWIADVCDKNLLYEVPEKPTIVISDDEDGAGEGQDQGPNGHEGGTQEDSNSDSDSDEDVPFNHLLKHRSNKWVQSNPKGKGETKEAYKERVLKIMGQGRLGQRKDGSSRDQSSSAPNSTQVEILQIASSAYDEHEGDARRKPSKILDSNLGPDGKRYLCQWKAAKGYDEDDEEEWVAESDMGKWTDLIQDYERVSCKLHQHGVTALW